MSTGIFSNLLERKHLDEVAPVVKAAASGSVEENYQLKDGVWKRNVTQLETLKAKFEREQLQCSSVDYAKMQDEIAYLENQTEISHRAMSEALTALEKEQFEQGKVWELTQKKQRLETLRAAISVCEDQLREISALEQSLPVKRLAVAAKRQNLWNEFAETQETIRKVENAHS
jgi:hypothetical protein